MKTIKSEQATPKDFDRWMRDQGQPKTDPNPAPAPADEDDSGWERLDTNGGVVGEPYVITRDEPAHIILHNDDGTYVFGVDTDDGIIWVDDNGQFTQEAEFIPADQARKAIGDWIERSDLPPLTDADLKHLDL